jgi:hypothetical protein
MPHAGNQGSEHRDPQTAAYALTYPEFHMVGVYVWVISQIPQDIILVFYSYMIDNLLKK